MKTLPAEKKIWSKHEIQSSTSRPSTVNLTIIELYGSIYRLTEMNILSKYNENPSSVKEI